KNRTRIGPHLAQPWQPKGQRFQPSKSAMSGGLNLSESPSTLRSKQVERSADHRSVARTVRAKSEAGLPAAQDQRAHFDRESKTAPRRGLRWFVTARLSVLRDRSSRVPSLGCGTLGTASVARHVPACISSQRRS